MTKRCPASPSPLGERVRSLFVVYSGFEYHRDGVGAINIYKRYLGGSQVVAGLAPVKGVRFKPHLCSNGVKK